MPSNKDVKGKKPDRYTVLILPSAQKQLGKLPSNVATRIEDKMMNLEDDPRPSGCKKPKGRDARECKASTTLDNLKEVHNQCLAPNNIKYTQLMTDDGSENAGPVRRWINTVSDPEVSHTIAERDVFFSNSMIEAANKQIKYRFLYHKHIPDFQALVHYVEEAVRDYNNRPHDILHGLTPFEVLHGLSFDKTSDQQ